MLRPQRKIHKKEIKEDALVTWYFRITRLLDRYRKQCMIVGATIVGLAILGVLMANSRRNDEKKAAGQLGLAETAFFSNDPARSVQELKPILDRHAGTAAAGNAAFYLANAQYQLGNLPEAEKYFKMVVDKYASNPLFASSSMTGLAQVAESRNEFSRAAEWYERAGRKFSKQFSAPFNLKEAARCWAAAGKPDKAKTILEDVEKKYPENQIKEEVKYLESSL
jgi:TolA-binding protein